MNIQSTSTTPQLQHLKVLIYGQAGAGKTRLCATTPREHTLILSAEAGLLSLRDYEIDFVAISGMRGLQEAYTYLRGAEHSYTWVCLDSISEIAEACLGEEKAQTTDGRRAYGEMADRMFKTLRAFRDLPMSVYMSAKAGRVDDEGHQVWGPMLPGRQLEQGIPYLFDEVFCLHAIRGDDGTVQRLLQTETDSRAVAKDRSGVLEPYEVPSLAHVYRKILTPPQTES